MNSIKIDWECKCDEILFDKIVIEPICAGAVISTEQLVEPNGNKREPDLLRVHIDTYTAVIQKKPVLLKDALQVKLKTRNLEIESSVAFVRDSKFDSKFTESTILGPCRLLILLL